MVSVLGPHCFRSSLASLSVGCTDLSHGALPAEGWITKPGTAQEGTTSPEQVLWGDPCPQSRERGTCSCLQGPPKVTCWGGCRKSWATGGRSRFITCRGMTVGDWSRTSFSGEFRADLCQVTSSGVGCCPFFHACLALALSHCQPLAPAPAPQLALVTPGVTGACCRDRCLHCIFLMVVSLLCPFLGSPIPAVPRRAITLAQPSLSHRQASSLALPGAPEHPTDSPVLICPAISG